MSEVFDAQELLRGVDADRARSWDFVRSLAAAFNRPLLDGDGIDPAELHDAEARLGFTLPAALREAYSLFGRRADLTSTQDRLLGPGRLWVEGDGGTLVVRVENQHGASWGVPMAAVGEDDPPVVVDAGSGWKPYCERLSLALVEMALSEATLAGGRHTDNPASYTDNPTLYTDNPTFYTDNRSLDSAGRAALESGFERLPLPDFPFWAKLGGPPVRWFAGADVVLRDDGGTWLWARARTAVALKDVRERMPGDWVMDSGDPGD